MSEKEDRGVPIPTIDVGTLAKGLANVIGLPPEEVEKAVKEGAVSEVLQKAREKTSKRTTIFVLSERPTKGDAEKSVVYYIDFEDGQVKRGFVYGDTKPEKAKMYEVTEWPLKDAKGEPIMRGDVHVMGMWIKEHKELGEQEINEIKKMLIEHLKERKPMVISASEEMKDNALTEFVEELTKEIDPEKIVGAFLDFVSTKLVVVTPPRMRVEEGKRPFVGVEGLCEIKGVPEFRSMVIFAETPEELAEIADEEPPFIIQFAGEIPPRTDDDGEVMTDARGWVQSSANITRVVSVHRKKDLEKEFKAMTEMNIVAQLASVNDDMRSYGFGKVPYVVAIPHTYQKNDEIHPALDGIALDEDGNAVKIRAGRWSAMKAIGFNGTEEEFVKKYGDNSDSLLIKNVRGFFALTVRKSPENEENIFRELVLITPMFYDIPTEEDVKKVQELLS